MKSSSSNDDAVDDSDTDCISIAMDDSSGDNELHNFEQLVHVRDHLLSQLEQKHQQSTSTPVPMREVLVSLPCTFNSSIDDLVETLYSGMQDRVTEDVVSNEVDEREGPLTCLQLTRTALTAAHVYALLLGNFSGAWTAIRMEAVSALANVQIDGQGFIFIPYAGRIKAAGQTPEGLRQAITRQLEDQTPDPQVTVARVAGDGATVVAATCGAGHVEAAQDHAVAVGRRHAKGGGVGAVGAAGA